MTIKGIKKLTRRSVYGTSLIGYLNTTYANILKKLGMPVVGSPDSKVKAQWIIQYKGMLFTIYDYRDSTPVTKITEWYIGGNTSVREYTLKAVAEIFSESKVKST